MPDVGALLARRWRLALWIAVGLLFALPLALVAHMPAMDLPGHLALAEVIRERSWNDHFLEAYFRAPAVPSANSLYYYAVGWVGRAVPIEWASKAFHIGALVLSPVAIALALRTAGAAPIAALIGFALATTFNLVAGFTSFAMGMAILVGLMALTRAHAERPTVRRAVLLALAAVLLYFAHAQTFLFGLGTIGLTALCCAPRVGLVRRVALVVASAVPAVALATPWFLHHLRLMAAAPPGSTKWSSVASDLRWLPVHTFDQLRGPWDSWLGLAIAALLAALLVVGRPPTGAAPWRTRYAYHLVALAAVVSYFVLPGHNAINQVICGRQAVLALLIAASCVHLDLARRLHRGLAAATLVAVIAYGALYARATFALAREVGDLPALLARAAPHGRMIAIDVPDSRVFRTSVLRHVASYHVVINHGLVANSFGTQLQSSPITVSARWNMPRYAPATVARDYDDVLAGHPLDVPGLELVGRSGRLFLYRSTARSAAPVQPTI